MEKQKIKTRKFTTAQLVRAIIATVVCGIVMVGACALKYYAIGNVQTSAWFGVISLIVAFAVFLAALLVLIVCSRTFIIANTRYYVAYLTVIGLTFLMHLFLSVVSPLLIAPGFAAIIIAQLSRKKQDAIIFNFFEGTMLLFALLFEAFMSGGRLGSVVTWQNNSNVMLLLGMSVVSLGAGAVIPLILRYKTGRLNYLIVGAAVLVISVALYCLIGVIHDNRVEVLSYSWLVVISGSIPIVAALFVNPIMEKAFNLVTDNRLVELTNANHPLLKRLANEAPGTYNHALAVANFAEICASAIGEDPYLARAAAYFHDVGKLSNPSYFAENQAGYNPHDDILPEVSAEIIRKHTTDGYRLLKEYRLPAEIVRVAIEHHGTMPISVFYERAKKLTDEEVDIDDFCYHGSTPTSKIAGIIMICDSSEAAIRAMDRPDGERVDKLLRSIINARVTQGQFDKCKLSLMDMDIIRQTIINAYGGLFHQRVKYPGGEKS